MTPAENYKNKMARINEDLQKSFMTDLTNPDKLSNSPDLEVRMNKLSNDPFAGTLVLNGSDYVEQGYGYGGVLDHFVYQRSIIESYRKIASNPDVNYAINLLTSEMAWTVDDDVFKIDIDEENEKISDTVNDAFRKILSLMNIKEKIFEITRQFYIDGQYNVSLAFPTKDGNIIPNKGIEAIDVVEPIDLYFDKKDRRWKYQEFTENSFMYDIFNKEKNIFTEAELVHIDYGLHQKIGGANQRAFMVNLGYLENVQRISNMVQTLENMLIPMRYSRSVSRRLFNIDVADLPPKQAKELMDKIRAEFRYKKSFDVNDGTIKNTRNTQPLVEDYWMSNRSGTKGTTVDTMDERGSAMDMDDIKHMMKKLYTSMNIPDEMNPFSDDQGSFSFDDTQITQTLMKFYIFISRLRIPVTKLLKEILRRELVATGVFSDKEWKTYQEKITINFTAELTFIDNMNKELFMKSLTNFNELKEQIGSLVSLQTAAKNTFGWSTEQLAEELKTIEEEKLDPAFAVFYGNQTSEEWQ